MKPSKLICSEENELLEDADTTGGKNFLPLSTRFLAHIKSTSLHRMTVWD